MSGPSATGPSRTPTVEPRLRARRIEVKRSEGRRRLRVLTGLLVVTVVGVGAVAVTQSSLADVDAVVVEGAARSAPDQVVGASGIVEGQPLLEVDVDGAADAIAQLPWVLGVDIERRWTGDVVVVIQERSPALALSTVDGGFVFVDDGGRQLERIANRPPEFLPIAGIVASGELGQPAPPETRSVLHLVSGMTEVVRSATSQILIDEGVLYLELAQGGRVKIGDDSSLDEKMVSLETMLAHADLRCLWEIDVRVPSAPALTRISAAGDPRTALTDLANCT